MQAVRPAQHAPAVARPVGKAQRGGEIVPVAVVGDFAQGVDLGRRSDRFVAQADLQREFGGDPPAVLHVCQHGVVAKAAVGVADGEAILAGRPCQQVFHGIPAEIRAEAERAAVVVALGAVDLLAQRLGSEDEVVAASPPRQPGAVAENVLRPVERDIAAGPDRLQNAAEQEKGAEGRLFGHEQRADPLEARAHVRRAVRPPCAIPCQPGAMALCRRVGVLPAHQLERLHVLQGYVISQRTSVAFEVIENKGLKN